MKANIMSSFIGSVQMIDDLPFSKEELLLLKEKGMKNVVSSEFIEIVLDVCRSREKLGYKTLHDSDMMEIYDKCEDIGLKLSRYERYFFEILEYLEKE